MANTYIENYQPEVRQAGGVKSLLPMTSRKSVVTVTASATLTNAQTGSTVVFNVASGATVTLPVLSTSLVGYYVDVLVLTTITSNSAIVVTGVGTNFLLGAIDSLIDATATDKPFFANGSSHTTLTMNGTTTGGIKGTQLRFTAVSSTIWNVTGSLASSGTLATPFS